MRKLILAAFLAFCPAVAAILPSAAWAQAEGYAISTAELMRATALDDIFTQFGATIEAAPREQAVPFNAAMNSAWREATHEIFAADAMHAALAAALEDKFEPEDYTAYAAFFESEFGRRVSAVERTATALSPDQQLAARDVGLVIASEATARRHDQIEEMLELVSADISTEMVRQSVRGMLIGLSMSMRQGDITVPWDEIDARLEALMPELKADIETTQRAMTFYAYAEFSDADIERYLGFLRTPAAQKLYAVAAYSVGEIVTERMHAFGEAIASKLARINV